MRARPLLATAIALAGLSAMAAAGCSHGTKPGADASADGAPTPVGTLIPDAAPINATTVKNELVEKVVNPQHLPAYAGPTGSVEGTIRIMGPESPTNGLSSATYAQCPAAEAEYGKLFRESAPDPEGRRMLADAVVIVTGYSGFFLPAKDEAAKVSIVDCGYDKRTVTMTFGQRLEVTNLTNEYWVPELDPKVPGAMMMAPPRADPVKLYPKEPGRYHLVDHDRKYVVDDLIVLIQPLHTVTDTNGHYRIDGVPVGDHLKVNVWHPRLPTLSATKDVKVAEGLVQTVDLTMNYRLAPPKDAGADADEKPYPGLH